MAFGYPLGAACGAYSKRLDADGIPAEEALDYETVREYMVVISRMTGYEEEDIRGYLENSFAELIWDWGYFALII